MIAVFFYGVAAGDLSNITVGWDSDGNGCGYSKGFENYPYLYWGLAPNTNEFNTLKEGNPLAK